MGSTKCSNNNEYVRHAVQMVPSGNKWKPKNWKDTPPQRLGIIRWIDLSPQTVKRIVKRYNKHELNEQTGWWAVGVTIQVPKCHPKCHLAA